MDIVKRLHELEKHCTLEESETEVNRVLDQFRDDSQCSGNSDAVSPKLLRSLAHCVMAMFYGRNSDTAQLFIHVLKALNACDHFSLPFLRRSGILLELHDFAFALADLRTAQRYIDNSSSFMKPKDVLRLSAALTHLEESVTRTDQLLRRMPPFPDANVPEIRNYPSTPYLPFSPQTAEGDAQLSNSDILQCNFRQEVIITEKLDGGNCCISFSDGAVYARTHTHEAGHDSFGPIKSLLSDLNSMHADIINQLKRRRIKLFGENMFAVHSIKYPDISSPFYVFAGYGISLKTMIDLEDLPNRDVLNAGIDVNVYSEWLSWDELAAISSLLGLSMVPTIYRGQVNDMRDIEALMNDWASSPSRLSVSVVLPEGFVIRSSGSFSNCDFDRNIAKYVRRQHIQTDSDWLTHWEKALIIPSTVSSTDTMSEPVKRFVNLIWREMDLFAAIEKIQACQVNDTSDIIFKFPRTPHLFDMGGSAVTRDDLQVDAGSPEAIMVFTCPIIIQEKVDGANVGFSLTQDFNIRAQNRSHFITSETSSQFSSLDIWIQRHRMELCAILRPNRDILFGEWLFARHSVSYDRLSDYFLAFDVYDKTVGRFISHARLTALLADTTIQMVHTILCGQPLLASTSTSTSSSKKSMAPQAKRAIAQLLESPSSFSSTSFLEGVYIRVDEGDWLKFRCKVVRPDFIQGIDDDGHWSKKTLERNSLQMG